MDPRAMFEVWAWMASLGFLAMLRQFIPREYTDRLRRNCRLWLQHLMPYITCDIPEFEKGVSNSLYKDVETYFSSLKVDGAQRLSLCKARKDKAVTFVLSNDERTFDTFDKARIEWVHRVYERSRPVWDGYDHQSDEKRAYTLQIKRKDKERMLLKYMEHIETKALELKRASRELLVHTNTKSRDGYIFSRRSSGPWQSVPFKHPANFDTLALDGDLKSRVVADLDSFMANESYYKRIGKAWKRGYLLYGPPGTGKSSMIAAIANKMRYDIYDLELMEVSSNTDLRKLLLSTSNKAIIVIEDIDCSLDLSGQRKKKKEEIAAATTTATTSGPPGSPGNPKLEKEQNKVTLSGLLNFVDGLWSSCGQERIFIFTTNHVEKLDPALLRAGRMDMHIHLSYCTFSAFKQLAVNYLEISEHELYPKLEAAFVGSYMTPAAVSELFIYNQSLDVDIVLEKVIAALDDYRVDPATIKKKEEDEEKEKEQEDSTTAPADSSAIDGKSESKEDQKGANDSPLTSDVPEDKQQVVETTAPQPQAETVEPQKIEVSETDSLKKDPLLVDGLQSAEPQSDKDVGEHVKEIPEVTKTVLVTSQETLPKKQSVDKTTEVK